MTEVSSMAEKSLASSLSGAVIFIVSNPLDVLKTRLQSDPRFMSSVDSRDVRLSRVGRSFIFDSTNGIGNAVPGRESGLQRYHHDKRVTGIPSEKVKRGRWANLKAVRVLLSIPPWGGIRKQRGFVLSSPKATEEVTGNGLLSRRSTGWFKFRTVEGMLRIYEQAGLRGLYRGVGFSIFTGVPQSVLYFNLLDYSKSVLSLKSELSPVTIAMLSGCFARVFTSVATAPLELLRTRILAMTVKTNVLSSCLAHLSMEIRRDGPGRLWNGIGATICRDILFSAIYFASYETMSSKLRLIMHSSNMNDHESLYAGKFFQAFIAGACSGSIAAVLTHPFDVMKTRIQVLETEGRISLSKDLLTTLRSENWKSMYAGLEPRIVRIVPACAIGFGVYEWGTHFLVQQRKQVACDDLSCLCGRIWGL